MYIPEDKLTGQNEVALFLNSVLGNLNLIATGDDSLRLTEQEFGIAIDNYCAAAGARCNG